MPRVIKGFYTKDDKVRPITQKQTSITDFISLMEKTARRRLLQHQQKQIQQPTTNPAVTLHAAARTRAKTYATGAKAAWEVLEDEYIAHYIQKEKARLEANIRNYEEHLKELGPKPTKKRQDVEFSISLWKRSLDRLNSGDPKWLEVEKQNARYHYNEIVKKAIKKGDPVPDEVIEQKPEFQVAKDARRRYEKGLHTSFANKSAAVNSVMFLEKGYKVKRQDGKQITDAQIQEIDDGIRQIQEAVGNAKDVMQKSDLTIAHTSGKFPFLEGGASGLFHPTENTITTGLELNLFGKKRVFRSLAHEWGHWLDYAAGADNKYGYELYSNGKSQRKIKSYKEALSSVERYTNPLYEKAQDMMNNDWQIRKLFNPSLNFREQTEEEKEAARAIRAQIGSYYRDPREIWARLVEQYVGEHHGKETIAAHSPEYYRGHPAYWSKENFEQLKPMVKAEIERRLQIARGQ